VISVLMLLFVIDILFTGNLILFHLEYHWSPTLLFPSVGPRYLSHCRTPLPRCCMERVLVALVVAAMCAVLYYVQLYWVSVMQCLLAFVLFFFHYLRCFRFQVFLTQWRAVLIRLI
jgi:hypothetical protein